MWGSAALGHGSAGMTAPGARAWVRSPRHLRLVTDSITIVTATWTIAACALVLQRHIRSIGLEAAFVVTAAGLGLPMASPPGPVQPVLALLRGKQQEAEQAPH